MTGCRLVDGVLFEEMNQQLTFEEVIRACASRARRWHDGDPDNWSPLEWAGAMCGESGEAANAAKKLKRLDDRIQNLDRRLGPDDDASAELYGDQIVQEVCDSILYGFCLVNRIGRTPSFVSTLVEVFNAKSVEYGFPERIGQ